MNQSITTLYVGLDVHKDSIDIATADSGRDGEVRHVGSIDARQPPASAISTLAGFPSAVLAAGPFGSICSGWSTAEPLAPGLSNKRIRSRLRAIYP